MTTQDLSVPKIPKDRVSLLLPPTFFSIISAIYRSSHRRRSIRKGVLRNFANSHVKIFFNKVAGLRPANLFKKILWHSCFPVNFLRTPFLLNNFGRLLLNIFNRFNASSLSQRKVSVFGFILVRIFPAFSRIRTEYGE